MKTIIDNTEKISRYIFEDNVPLTITNEHIITPDFIIGDLNANNSTMHENITPPEDWKGCKYKYSDNQWTLNPGYSEPEISPGGDWIRAR